MDTEEWHKWRASGIGASDAPVIMGVSPWKTVHQLWEEKAFGKSNQTETPAMKRGKELEGPALEFFTLSTGIPMVEQKMCVHNEHQWMRATLDGINEEKKALLEIKSCGKLHEEVPKHYYPQLQHQMAVAGYEKMYYLSFNGTEGKILNVQRDDKYIEELIRKEKKFWNQVSNFEEPELSEKDFVDKTNDIEWMERANEVAEVRRELKDLKEREAFLISELILFAEGRNAFGGEVRLTHASRKGSVNYSSIPQLKEVDLDQFRGESKQYWRVTTPNT